MLDIREAQDTLEDALRDAVLYALGKRYAAVTSVAALRAVPTQGAAGTALNDDCLAATTITGTTTGYRWNSQSEEVDDGAGVIKPDDIAAGDPGRWISWTSPLRISLAPGQNSRYLHEITSGILERVILLDRHMDDAEVGALIFGQVPSVVIEATDDDPDDLTLNTGHRWDTEFHFTISTISQNLRDRRQAAQGSTYSGELEQGANKIDGLVQALLCGTQLHAVIDGIRNVRSGRGYNWVSNEGQRRVIRGRSFTVMATVEYPPAPNDYGPAEQINAQAEMTDLGATDPPWEMDNYISSGFAVGLGAGLTRTVQTGTAILDGEEVEFAGELYTFTANRHTYRDLNPDGTMSYVESEPSQAEPPVTEGALRIGVTMTDGSGITGDRLLARSRVPYGANMQHPLE